MLQMVQINFDGVHLTVYSKNLREEICYFNEQSFNT